MKHELHQAVIQVTETVSIEGVDADFSAKVEVLPVDRIDGDYKITMSFRRSHGQGDITDETILNLWHESVSLANEALDDYNRKGGKQLTLNFTAPDAPKEARKVKGEPKGEAASN